MEEPLLSICIPTYNRAELLDYCLEGLREFERYDIPFEIVVSDNASEDQTPDVLRSQAANMPYLKVVRLDATKTIAENGFNSFQNAKGRSIVYLADDDSIIPEQLVEYAKRLVAAPDLSVIYADWIAYNDAEQRELHRYFHFSEPVSFGPDDPLGLIDFVLRHMVLPEMGIYRRDALLRSQCLLSFTRRTLYTPMQWMYCLSRVGTVAFELAPFYREHRVLKARLRREEWCNVQLRHEMIGDELRNMLESIVLWAYQDSGLQQAPQDQLPTIRQMIDNFLNARVPLEINRAIAARDWLLATELRRRLVLWQGPGTPEQQRQDVTELVLPAALQAVALGYRQLGTSAGLILWGFHTSQLAKFFRQNFPDIPLREPDTCKPTQLEGQPAVLFRDRSAARGFSAFAPLPSRTFQLDSLVHMYRVNPAKVDISGL